MIRVAMPAGQLNTPPEVIVEHVRSACARQLPQAKPYAPNGQRVALVAGGPSLASTFEALKAQVFRGDKIVAVNGAYQWLLERNIHPSNMVMVDARPFNARFVQPVLSSCKYFVSSQCAPETFDALDGQDVTLFHSCGEESLERPVVDAYFFQCWHSVAGSTVTIQAIQLLRMLGFLRMDLYGFDSCWISGAHHGYAQSENDHDKRMTVWSVPTSPTGDPLTDQRRRFECAPWHMKQAEDFQRLIKHAGDSMLLRVHGDGLIAHMMTTAARLSAVETEEAVHA